MTKNIETTPIAIRVWSNEHTQANLNLTVDGVNLCHILLEKGEKDQGKYITYTFDLPKDARALNLSGTYENYDSKQQISGNQNFKILDIAPIMQTLRDTSRPFGQRLIDFKKAVLAFFDQHYPESEAWYSPSDSLRFGKGVPDNMIKAAEQRLGFNLPAEHVNVLRKMNFFAYADSGCDRVEEITTAYNWGNLKEYEYNLDANTIAFFKSSVVLYTDVGDGIGGLLYQPKGTSECGKQGAYYWLFQGTLDELLLKNSDGSCKNYTEAMIWLLANRLFSDSEYFYHAFHNAGEDTHILLVDHSTPNTLTLDLTYPSLRSLPNDNLTYEEALDWLGFQFNLYIAWDKFE